MTRLSHDFSARVRFSAFNAGLRFGRARLSIDRVPPPPFTPPTQLPCFGLYVLFSHPVCAPSFSGHYLLLETPQTIGNSFVISYATV